jgi:hypothetical protein
MTWPEPSAGSYWLAASGHVFSLWSIPVTDPNIDLRKWPDDLLSELLAHVLKEVVGRDGAVIDEACDHHLCGDDITYLASQFFYALNDTERNEWLTELNCLRAK